MPADLRGSSDRGLHAPEGVGQSCARSTTVSPSTNTIPSTRSRTPIREELRRSISSADVSGNAACGDRKRNRRDDPCGASGGDRRRRHALPTHHHGRSAGLEQGRTVVRRSFELATYRLAVRSPWETDYAAFRALKGTSGLAQRAAATLGGPRHDVSEFVRRRPFGRPGALPGCPLAVQSGRSSSLGHAGTPKDDARAHLRPARSAGMSSRRNPKGWNASRPNPLQTCLSKVVRPLEIDLAAS